MQKIHLVLTKDVLRSDRNIRSSAIVLDIIFATTSITAALQAGVDRVLPALDLDEAKRIGAGLSHDDWVLAGEKNAESFAGFRSYEPLALCTPDMAGKDLIYATTNGTVALRRAYFFSRVYAACLRNGPAVARHVLEQTARTEDIVIICAGSIGRFSLEDFYGAGYMVHCLRRLSGQPLACSDAALAAELAFQDTDPYDVLIRSRLGRLMESRGLERNVAYASELDCSDVVGFYDGDCVKNVFLGAQRQYCGGA